MERPNVDNGDDLVRLNKLVNVILRNRLTVVYDAGNEESMALA